VTTPPVVSVVTPFTNQAAYLDQAIVSVRAQTFAEWELVLVDDGATDGSRAVAERAAAADPARIRVVDAATRHGGAAAARNHGLRLARGTYAAFLDADDVFLPAKLADGVAILATHPAVAILHAPTRWWYDGVPGRDWTERPGVATDRAHPPPTLLIDVMLRQRGDIPCTCGVLLRRDAALAVGGFEERFALYEDQSLWAKLFLLHPAWVTSRCHARYRQHATSTSALAAARGDYDRYRTHAAQEAFFAWLADWVMGHGAHPTVLRAIARARAIERRPLAGKVHVLAARTLRRFVAGRLS
jgi:glycosyltransferase involved in cell wall biosynthesis